MNAVSSAQNFQDRLSQRMARDAGTIESIRAAMIKEMQRFGFEHKQTAVKEDLVNPELRVDPFDGSESFYAEWRTPSSALLGYVLIHGGGQSYAEFDVLAMHPDNKGLFVEAIVVWGNGDKIRSELRSLTAPLG